MSATRIRLHRTKGWRLPEGAVAVARPSRWGNPYRIDDLREYYPDASDHALRAMCVSDFRGLVEGRWDGDLDAPSYKTTDEIRWHLRGKDLACWCPLDQPCHADVLLEVANR